MEDYKKKYETAIKQAKEELKACGDLNCDAARQIFRFFPELKESEDERIRKDIIKYLEQSQFGEEHYLIDDDVVRGYIAWLEKQGEQKQHLELKAGHWYFCHQAYCCRADHLTVKEGERFMCEKDGVVKGFLIKEPEKYFREVCPPAPMEDEQKPTDKVEQKSVWSEEDGNILTQIINEMEAIKFSSSTILEKNVAQEKIAWLKSLKERMKGE